MGYFDSITPHNKSSLFVLCGVDVDFPHKHPDPAQKALISNAIKACLNFENALLESPTDTGKSLVLLAAALADQKHIGSHPILLPIKRDPYVPHPEEMTSDFAERHSLTFTPASQLLKSPLPLDPDSRDALYKCNVAVKRHTVPVWYTSANDDAGGSEADLSVRTGSLVRQS